MGRALKGVSKLDFCQNRLEPDNMVAPVINLSQVASSLCGLIGQSTYRMTNSLDTISSTLKKDNRKILLFFFVQILVKSFIISSLLLFFFVRIFAKIFIILMLQAQMNFSLFGALYKESPVVPRRTASP